MTRPVLKGFVVAKEVIQKFELQLPKLHVVFNSGVEVFGRLLSSST
jgi:hypothetical protein